MNPRFQNTIANTMGLEKKNVKECLNKQEEKIRMEKVLGILLEADFVCLGKLLEKNKSDSENKKEERKR